MLDNDGVTYHYQKPSPQKLAERALITLERTQKLDLLIHLLTNLRQPLVVCGPLGIGKTTLLQTLIASRSEQLHFCHLQGSSMQSFESILQQLSRTLNIFGSSIQLDIGALCDACQQRQMVLIVDDAGDLMPGLIGELIGFAAPLNGLRLVFAMTNDEFQAKTGSDGALEDCHVIELPPLNRKQCRDYLQNLSTHPAMPLTFNGINDALVDDLFDKTHGIPGRILAELPSIDRYHSRRSRIGWLAAAATVGLAAGGWFLQDALTGEVATPGATEVVTTEPAAIISPAPTAIATPTLLTTDLPSSTPEPTPAVVASELPTAQPPAVNLATPSASPTANPTPTTQTVATAQPSISSKTTTTPLTIAPATPLPPTATPTATPSPSLMPVATATATASVLAVTTATASPTPTTSPTSTAKPSPTTTPTPSTSASPAPTAKPQTVEQSGQPLNDHDWIMAQPADNFTLQVMTLSNRDGVRRFMKKYAEYGESLKYYTVQNGEQERFILIYGSFDTIADAKRYKEIMPGEFKQALEKRFRTIQKESRR